MREFLLEIRSKFVSSQYDRDGILAPLYSVATETQLIDDEQTNAASRNMLKSVGSPPNLLVYGRC
jgi:hypothetical protein